MYFQASSISFIVFMKFCVSKGYILENMYPSSYRDIISTQIELPINLPQAHLPPTGMPAKLQLQIPIEANDSSEIFIASICPKFRTDATTAKPNNTNEVAAMIDRILMQELFKKLNVMATIQPMPQPFPLQRQLPPQSPVQQPPPHPFYAPLPTPPSPPLPLQPQPLQLPPGQHPHPLQSPLNQNEPSHLDYIDIELYNYPEYNQIEQYPLYFENTYVEIPLPMMPSRKKALNFNRFYRNFSINDALRLGSPVRPTELIHLANNHEHKSAPMMTYRRKGISYSNPFQNCLKNKSIPNNETKPIPLNLMPIISQYPFYYDIDYMNLPNPLMPFRKKKKKFKKSLNGTKKPIPMPIIIQEEPILLIPSPISPPLIPPPPPPPPPPQPPPPPLTLPPTCVQNPSFAQNTPLAHNPVPPNLHFSQNTLASYQNQFSHLNLPLPQTNQIIPRPNLPFLPLNHIDPQHNLPFPLPPIPQIPLPLFPPHHQFPPPHHQLPPRPPSFPAPQLPFPPMLPIPLLNNSFYKSQRIPPIIQMPAPIITVITYEPNEMGSVTDIMGFGNETSGEYRMQRFQSKLEEDISYYD